MEMPARTSVALLFRRTPVKYSGAAGVVATAVGAGVGVGLIETAEDLHVATQQLERSERRVQFKLGGRVAGGGPETGRDGPIGKEDEGGAERRARRGGGQSGPGGCSGGTEATGAEGSESGERDAGTEALEEMSAVHRGE